jgi:hypothetical protein
VRDLRLGSGLGDVLPRVRRASHLCDEQQRLEAVACRPEPLGRRVSGGVRRVRRGDDLPDEWETVDRIGCGIVNSLVVEAP